MRALILTQHFTPEVTAGRFRMQSFVEALVEAGHEVEVLCAVPNHPQGAIQEGFRRRLLVRGHEHGAEVRYVWVLVRRTKTFATRLGFYASYAAMASVVGTFMSRPDLVLASSPPLPVGAAGALLARRHRVPWILDVRDLWPESAVALGELSNGRLISAAERLERGLYARANAIVTVNDAFRAQIAASSPDRKTIAVIPNGTTRDWLEAGRLEPDRIALGLPDDRFLWAYAGNIGLAHELPVAVEAAELLGDGFQLLIIGEGPQRDAVERRAAASRPGLVELRPLMAPREAAMHLRVADALLVSERQDRTVASKLYDYCAVGRPVVAACRGELRRVIESAGVGLAVEHGDAVALASAVRRLRDDPALRTGFAQRQREFAREHLREAQAQRLVDLAESVTRA